MSFTTCDDMVVVARAGSAPPLPAPPSSDRASLSAAADKPDRIERRCSPVGLDLPLGAHTNCAHCHREFSYEERSRARKFCNGTCAAAAAQPIVSRARERWGTGEEDERDDR